MQGFEGLKWELKWNQKCSVIKDLLVSKGVKVNWRERILYTRKTVEVCMTSRVGKGYMYRKEKPLTTPFLTVP